MSSKRTSVSDHLIDIKTGLAENTLETRQLKEQVTALNGKVAGHETRMQASESSQALLSQTIQMLHEREDKREAREAQREDFWQENRSKFVWGLIGVLLMLFYWLLTNNGFPKFLN